MKKTLVVLITFIPFAVFAEGIFDSLGEYQKTLSSDSSKPSAPESGIRVLSEANSQSPGVCEENDQTSVPLKYLSNLILENNGALKIEADNRSGKLAVSSKKFINNCASMLKWDMRQVEMDGEIAYVVEAKIAKPEDKCKKEGCSYQVVKVVKDEPKREEMVFEPTLKGFKKCLEKSGIVDSKGKVNPKAIYSGSMQHSWSGVKDTGRVLFVSHGLGSAKAEAKYGDFVKIDKCDHYEKISPTLDRVLSYEREQQDRLQAEADKLKGCNYSEYGKVADFIERYESFSGELGVILNKLMKEAAQKSALAIAEGKATPEDYKVIADFKKLIVMPEAEKVVSISNQIGSGTGDMNQLQAQLKAAQQSLASYNEKPYFQNSHLEKLISDGHFDEADNLNSLRLVAKHYSQVGNKVNGVTVNSKEAGDNVNADTKKFLKYLDQQRDFYAVKTGQDTGRVSGYQKQKQKTQAAILKKLQDLGVEYQENMIAAQGGGQCAGDPRNITSCRRNAQLNMEQITREMAELNAKGTKLMASYDEKIKMYEPYEAEFRREEAKKNGETVADDAKVDVSIGQRSPTGGYTFDYSLPQNPQQQMPQQQFPQQQPPWYQYQSGANLFQTNQNQFMPINQQQNYLGSQNYSQFGFPQQQFMGNQSSYTFGWNGGGMPQQQSFPMYGQQQPGFWGNQAQGYANNSFSFYGGWR